MSCRCWNLVKSSTRTRTRRLISVREFADAASDRLDALQEERSCSDGADGPGRDAASSRDPAASRSGAHLPLNTTLTWNKHKGEGPHKIPSHLKKYKHPGHPRGTRQRMGRRWRGWGVGVGGASNLGMGVSPKEDKRCGLLSVGCRQLRETERCVSDRMRNRVPPLSLFYICRSLDASVFCFLHLSISWFHTDSFYRIAVP